MPPPNLSRPELALIVGRRKAAAEESLRALGIDQWVYLTDVLHEGPYDQMHPGLLKAADDWQLHHGASAVVATSDRTMMLAAQLRSRYGLPGLGLDETAAGTNKLLMRQTTASAVRAPRAWPASSFLTVATDELEVDEVVVKPLNASSSRGVRRLAVAEARQWLATEADEFHIVEEALRVNRELHTEGLVIDGAVSWLECSEYDRPLLSAGYGHQVSTILPPTDPMRPLITAMTQEVLTAMGVSTSVFHVEFLVQDEELYFGEVGLRPAGSGVAELLDLTLGCGLWTAHMCVQMGRDPRGTEPTRQAEPITGLIMARLDENGQPPLPQAEADRLPNILCTLRGPLSPGEAPPTTASAEYFAMFTGLDRRDLTRLIDALNGGGP